MARTRTTTHHRTRTTWWRVPLPPPLDPSLASTASAGHQGPQLGERPLLSLKDPCRCRCHQNDVSALQRRSSALATHCCREQGMPACGPLALPPTKARTAKVPQKEEVGSDAEQLKHLPLPTSSSTGRYLPKMDILLDSSHWTVWLYLR